jgi:hypothetical protein
VSFGKSKGLEKKPLVLKLDLNNPLKAEEHPTICNFDISTGQARQQPLKQQVQIPTQDLES